MLFEGPGIYIRVSMKLPPSLEPFAFFTAIVFIVYSHTIFMRLTQLVWYPFLTNPELMILRSIMNQDSTLVRRRWPGLASSTLRRV